MHKIEIENFGPIKKIDMKVSGSIFLLGEQASGKSIIAKLIYFFRTISDDFINVMFSNKCTDIQDYKKSCQSLIIGKFENVFGATRILGNFFVRYTFTDDIEDIYIKIYPNESYKLCIDLSISLENELAKIWDNFHSYLSVNEDSPNTNFYGRRNKLINNLFDASHIFQNIFNIDTDTMYIPAGRALLSRQNLYQIILGNEISRIKQNKTYAPYDIIDALTLEYIYEVIKIREASLSNFDDDEDITYLINLCGNILKGIYVYKNQSDYIKLDDGALVSLAYSSSGQQEVVWLLNLLLYYSYLKKQHLIIIEEPETHLHPDAQYLLMKFIAAFCNITHSQVFITTHSPYILSSVNNFFYANRCGNNVKKFTEANNVISKQSWLDADKCSAYMMENCNIRNIKDDGLGIIDISVLDAIASVQDEEYEKLYKIIKGD